jgi:hypothetical protein
MAENNPNKAVKGVSIHINGTQFFVQSPVLGAELRRLGDIPASNLLFMERPGPDPDIRIEANAMYELKAGTHFYDLPPGTVGGR